MKPLTSEWVAKAEGDWASAGRELRARKSPNYDAACFHAQQCAEKYLKARLEEDGAPIPQTHSLLVLLGLLGDIESAWALFEPDLRELTAYAVATRRPGATASRDDARAAVAACDGIRASARAALGLR
ncbi:MAG: HEPN domain-containing protein [Armatimonadetes bacterium]|nr:HEPN domain-containing protein [Armatimonadota bacterium]